MRLRAMDGSEDPQRSKAMSDAFFLILGLGLIGVMALYAHALSRA
jgi:hypothetical protein